MNQVFYITIKSYKYIIWNELKIAAYLATTTRKPVRKPQTTVLWQTRTTPAKVTRTTQAPQTTRPTSPETTTSKKDCVTGTYYPHESCSQFYVCVNGHLVEQSCAPGLSWNAQDGMCDWNFKVKCLPGNKIAQKFNLLNNQYIGDRKCALRLINNIYTTNECLFVCIFESWAEIVQDAILNGGQIYSRLSLIFRNIYYKFVFSSSIIKT